MSWEGAEVGVDSGFAGSKKSQCFRGVGIEKLGRLQNALIFGNEVLLCSLRAFCHFIGCRANALDGSALLQQEKIVRSGIRIRED